MGGWLAKPGSYIPEGYLIKRGLKLLLEATSNIYIYKLKPSGHIKHLHTYMYINI